MERSLAEIAEVIGGVVQGNPQKRIAGVGAFEDATPDMLTLAMKPKFLERLEETNAGAFIVPREFECLSVNLIQTDNPYAAFARALSLFEPSPRGSGISTNAVIGRRFVCGDPIIISGHVYIGDDVVLGDRVVLNPGVVIEDKVHIGSDTIIAPNVTVRQGCRIGKRVRIQAGTVIGSDGFGFAPEGKAYVRIPHRGIVRIDDDVDIGAGNTIDRGTLGETWIKRGVKTDNLVHIAHNVTIGENTLLVAQVGIAGSTSIGDHVTLAGQAGVAGHLTIGDNVIIGPKAGIAKSIPEGQIVSGVPEMPHRLWLKVSRVLPRLPELQKKVSKLEKLMTQLKP